MIIGKSFTRALQNLTTALRQATKLRSDHVIARVLSRSRNTIVHERVQNTQTCVIFFFSIFHISLRPITAVHTCFSYHPSIRPVLLVRFSSVFFFRGLLFFIFFFIINCVSNAYKRTGLSDNYI